MINRASLSFGAKSPASSFFVQNGSSQDQTARANRIFRDQGANFRLGMILQDRFKPTSSKPTKIDIHAASLGNQRIDIVMGAMVQKIREAAKTRSLSPQKLLATEPNIVGEALKAVGEQFKLSASDVDARQVQAGQNGMVHYSGVEKELYRNAGDDYWGRLLGTTSPDFEPIQPIIDGLYKSLVTTPSPSFIVDNQGGIKLTDYELLRRVMGKNKVGDAFKAVGINCRETRPDVLVSSNWLGYFLAKPDEIGENKPGVEEYLAKAADHIAPNGLLVLGGLDLATDIPKLLPKGRFKPVQDRTLLAERAHPSGDPKQVTKEPFVFERVA